MKRLVLVLLLFTGGCSGVALLGTHTRIDGTTLEFIQATTRGESGPKIRVLETHIFNPATGKSILQSRYSASGQGIIDAVISTSMPAAISGQFGVMAARARRPNKTTVTQSGGGASSSSEAKGGEATNNNNPTITTNSTSSPVVTSTSSPTLSNIGNPTTTTTTTSTSSPTLNNIGNPTTTTTSTSSPTLNNIGNPTTTSTSSPTVSQTNRQTQSK